MMLNRMLEEANSLLSWNDVLGFLSLRGYPKASDRDGDEDAEFNFDLIAHKEVRNRTRESGA